MESPKDYSPAGDRLDPFLKGRSFYLDQLERVAKDRDSWKKSTQKLVLVALVMTLGIVYISMRSEYIPFMVRVDKTTGYTEAIGPITEVKYSPQEAEITYLLGEFIRDIRTVPLDPVVYKGNWNAASNFLSARANQKLNMMIANEEQAAGLGKVTVLPRIISIQPMANTNGNTYLVRWEEEVFYIGGTGGKLVNTYSGNITFTITPPKKKEAYYKNPIGLIIEDLSYEKENAALNPKGGSPQ
ncbi:MAG: type IV secretion system protein [Negativicutes bacterium]|nr:type IV secretion system protein [Negativicutes bacterium]